MKFRRIDNDEIVDAKVWLRHGDHPVVRAATGNDLPASSEPGRYGWIEGCGLVLPGDWVVIDANGKPCVVRERSFRKNFEPSSVNT